MQRAGQYAAVCSRRLPDHCSVGPSDPAGGASVKHVSTMFHSPFSQANPAAHRVSHTADANLLRCRRKDSAAFHTLYVHCTAPQLSAPSAGKRISPPYRLLHRTIPYAAAENSDSRHTSAGRAAMYTPCATQHFTRRLYHICRRSLSAVNPLFPPAGNADSRCCLCRRSPCGAAAPRRPGKAPPPCRKPAKTACCGNPALSHSNTPRV